MSKMGYLLAKGAFALLREKMDVRKANGGVFLGLNGIVVKSHGGTDDEGFAAAVELGYDMAKGKLKDRIDSELRLFHGRVRPSRDNDEEPAAAEK
jgi:glycerol-3-phosphate acyltransferase PlsX